MAITHPTLVVDAAFDVAAALIYGVVGYLIAKRPVSDESRLAARLFSVWWFGLAGISFVGALTSATASIDALTLPALLAINHLAIVVLVVVLWALQYYLTYLFTGSKGWLVPISVYYSLLYAGLVYLVVSAHPTTLDINKWSVSAGPQPSYAPTFGLILSAVFLGPTIVGALGYLSLAFRAPERTQRFRITVVSLALLIWFGSSTVASGLGLSRTDAWQFGSRFIGLGASMAILMAYKPPRWMQKRFKIAPVIADGEKGPHVESLSGRPRAAGAWA